MRVGVVMKKIIGHGIDDAPRDLRSTRTVEVGDRASAVLPLQRRKMFADFLDGSDDARRTERGIDHAGETSTARE